MGGVITRMVQECPAANQRNAGADVGVLERDSDELVYALYGLTSEEKALVQAAYLSTSARQVTAAK